MDNKITEQIIGAAIEVHRHLGAGLLESTYEACLCKELKLRNIEFQSQLPFSVEYKGLKVDCGYRLDLLIEKSVIVEIKSVDEILPIHEAQLITYLKLTKIRIGLLINFNVPLLKDGLRRFIV